MDKLFGGRSITVTLTPTERLALLQAITIGMEDGSLEPWAKAARSAQKKISEGKS